MKLHTANFALLFMFGIAYTSAATIIVNPNPQVSTSLIVDAITGADMGGLIVRATYATPSHPTIVNLIWAQTGPTSGAASSPFVTIALSGDTSTALAWSYTSRFLSPLTSLEFDGTAAGIYFDRASPNPGTPGSGPGSDIVFGPPLPAGLDSLIAVTYSSAVSLGANPAQNDLYARLRMDFGTAFGPQDFTFTQDTDRNPVPEPASALLVLGGLVLCGGVRGVIRRSLP